MAPNENMQLTRQIAVALVVAPLSTIVTFTIVLWLMAGGLPERGVDGLVHAGVFLALFGIPIAYAAEFLLALIVYCTLYNRPVIRGRTIVGASAICGMLIMPLIWASFGGGRVAWEMSALGGLIGAVAGATFSFIAFRGSASRPAI
jgi:hypothetical protein